MLTAEEEQALICAWQQHRDHQARDRLINAFAPLAASIAKRFRRGSGEVDLDLIQQAQIGLIKAADRFDPERSIRFATYAVWWVRAEVQEYARANTSVVRRPNSARTRAAAREIAALNVEMEADANIDLADADKKLAAALGVDPQKAADLRQQVTGRDSSLNVPVLEEDGADRMALLVDPESLEEPVALKSLQLKGLRRILVDALKTLPSRECSIIVATQISDPPATLEELGARHGISRERVRQLRERGLERLRAALCKRDFELDSFF